MSSWNSLHWHISCVFGFLSWSWATCTFWKLLQLKLDKKLTWLYQDKALYECTPDKFPKPNCSLALGSQHHRTSCCSRHFTAVKESPLTISPDNFFILLQSSFFLLYFAVCILYFGSLSQTKLGPWICMFYTIAGGRYRSPRNTQHVTYHFYLFGHKGDSNGYRPHPHLSPKTGFQYLVCA